MAELKGLFEALGFQSVQTYIQSGNIIFQAEEDDAALRERIEQAIETKFGFPVTTVLRSAADLKRVIEACPYVAEAAERLYVFFLADAPASDRVARLAATPGDVDEFRVAEREVYLHCRQGMADTKFTNAFFEKKLGVAATGRNWQTTVTLARMAMA